MDQIYYTQCPVGYGLGASNGYQVKRISTGYPATADLRHLNLRAFLPSSRVLAPPVLRYRRDGEVAEVARLTPREKEFETERGPWGRPGGHFAHGLRLAPAEMGRIASWPAGLFDAPFWRTTDREATRGRPPEPIDLEAIAPAWEAIARTASGLDRDLLARLLAASAACVRDGRTLYLIGEPGRLPDLIALLTYAFPPPHREALTFSTYHDRPEELTGFRLQGTSPEARPNRAALAASGVVADLAPGVLDPAIAAPAWAFRLAEGLRSGDGAGLHRRAERAKLASPSAFWDDAWLSSWADADGLIRDPAAASDATDWPRLAELASWAGRAGLADEWVAARPPSWWVAAAGSYERPEARAAFVATIRWPDAWVGIDPSAWGVAAAAWFGRVEARARHEAIAAAWKAIPASGRPPFLAAMIPELPARAAEATLAWLRDRPGFDGRSLVPLEVRRAAREAGPKQDPRPLADVLAALANDPSALRTGLDALASEAGGREEAVAALAPALARAYASWPDGPGRGEVESWALRQGGLAAHWLAPALRRACEGQGEEMPWARLRDRTPEPMHPAVASLALEAALGPGLPGRAFTTAVETLLLPLDDARRPSRPGWAEAYMRRTASELDLIHGLYGEPGRGQVPGLKGWIYAARDLGELSADQAGRIARARNFTIALGEGGPALLRIDLPAVRPPERGPLLGQMLRVLGPSALGTCLDCARSAWPEGFAAGSEGLDALARPIARCLAGLRDDPPGWIAALDSTLARVGLLGPDEAAGFEPDGLAAEILGASTRPASSSDPAWPLRQAILRDDRRWRALAVDARRDLAEAGPDRALERFAAWDRRIDQGRHRARFLELAMNAAGASIAAIAEAVAEELAGLGVLPWWASKDHPGAADDLREAYARLAPMAPLRQPSRSLIARWLRSAEAPAPSDPAERRRRALGALAEFHAEGSDQASRLNLVRDWCVGDFPLRGLPREDARRFVSWVIAGLGPDSAAHLERFGERLAEAGNVEPDDLRSWAEGMPDEARALVPQRVAVVSELARALTARRADIRQSRRGTSPADSP